MLKAMYFSKVVVGAISQPTQRIGADSNVITKPARLFAEEWLWRVA